MVKKPTKDKTLIEKIDTDGNGRITQKEVKAFEKKLKDEVDKAPTVREVLKKKSKVVASITVDTDAGEVIDSYFRDEDKVKVGDTCGLCGTPVHTPKNVNGLDVMSCACTHLTVEV